MVKVCQVFKGIDTAGFLQMFIYFTLFSVFSSFEAKIDDRLARYAYGSGKPFGA